MKECECLVKPRKKTTIRQSTWYIIFKPFTPFILNVPKPSYVNKCEPQQNKVAFGSTQERNFYDPSINFSHFHLLERAT
jgi:hypothetical protein